MKLILEARKSSEKKGEKEKDQDLFPSVSVEKSLSLCLDRLEGILYVLKS